MTVRRILLILVGATAVFTHVSASAQAFCSLRDPNSYVRDFFPDSSSYKSIVRTISRDVAKKITSEKGVEFDPREFGNHTLYVAYKEKKIVGFLQAHSEVVDWGVAEVVWSVDQDGRLLKFGFQRCRSPERKAVEAEKVQKLFRGLSEEALRSKLAKEGVDGILRAAGLSIRSKKLVEGISNGALKMQVLLRSVWAEEFAAVSRPRAQ